MAQLAKKTIRHFGKDRVRIGMPSPVDYEFMQGNMDEAGVPDTGSGPDVAFTETTSWRRCCSPFMF